MQQQSLEEAAEKHHVDHLLTTIIEWCKNEAPDFFDDSFVHQLYIQHYEGVRDLSPRQIAALENIACKFNIVL
ncbi:MAG: hypothetical protein V4568_08350 [Pseudomonadota bacterium]